eukprot:3554899-Rhodomonas_salina.1
MVALDRGHHLNFEEDLKIVGIGIVFFLAVRSSLSPTILWLIPPTLVLFVSVVGHCVHGLTRNRDISGPIRVPHSFLAASLAVAAGMAERRGAGKGAGGKERRADRDSERGC